MTETPCPSWCTSDHEDIASHLQQPVELQRADGVLTVSAAIGGGRPFVSAIGYSLRAARSALLTSADATDWGHLLIASGRDPELGQALIAAADQADQAVEGDTRADGEE